MDCNKLESVVYRTSLDKHLPMTIILCNLHAFAGTKEHKLASKGRYHLSKIATLSRTYLTLGKSISYLKKHSSIQAKGLSTYPSMASICSAVTAKHITAGAETCRMCRYEELGKAVLGEKWGFWAVATTQFVLLVGLMVTYMVTAGQSLQAASNPDCNDHTMQVSTPVVTTNIAILCKQAFAHLHLM